MNLPVVHKQIASQVSIYREAVQTAFSAPKLKELAKESERIQRIAEELGAHKLAVEFSIISSEVREKVANLMPAVPPKRTGRGKKTIPSDGIVYSKKQIQHFRELYNPGPRQKVKLTAGEIEQTRQACRRDSQIFTDSLLRDRLNIKRGKIWGGYRKAGHSENIEVYTSPPEIIQRVKKVFGQIDLDPSSSLKSQKIVGARHTHTNLADCLKSPWWGNVFLNAPNSLNLLNKFCEKLHDKGIRQAIVLFNNDTQKNWAQDIFKIANVICFPRSRLAFWKNNKERQMIIGIRVKQKNFCQAFSDIGFCAPLGWDIQS